MAIKRENIEGWNAKVTVRARYAAIAASCLLLAGLTALTVRQAANWVLSTMPDSALLPARALRWGVNHIGMRPLLLMGFAGLGALLFWMRAGKLDGDLRALSGASKELADGVPMRDIRKIAGGELGGIARHLDRAERRMRQLEDRAIAAESENRSAGTNDDLEAGGLSQTATLEDWANLARKPMEREYSLTNQRGETNGNLPLPPESQFFEKRPRFGRRL